MRRFGLSRRSLRDIREIWEFISHHSFDAADQVVEDFYAAFGQLADMPGLGYRRNDLTGQNVLFWAVYS